MKQILKKGIALLCAMMLLASGLSTMAAETSVEPEIVPLAAGYLHSAIIKADGTLWTSGSNAYGQLGTTPQTQPDEEGGQALGTDSAVFVQTMENARAVYARYLTTFAIDNNGTLYGWGWNEGAQLGLGDSKDRTSPTEILADVAAAAPGRFHSAAVTTDGTLWTWGWNDSGQLGNGTTTSLSAPKEALTGVRSVALGIQHTLAVKSDNTLWAAGDNTYGQLADGTTGNGEQTDDTENSEALSFRQVMTNVRNVACTAFGTLILKTDGTLWACGYNANGELGNGTYDNIYEPVKILSGVSAISCGEDFSAAIGNNGDLYAWGNNAYGQYGQEMNPYPTVIDHNVTNVSLGGGHMLYLQEDGTVQGIGNNEKGQLGNDSRENTNTAVTVADSVAAIPRAASSNGQIIGIVLLVIAAAAVVIVLLIRRLRSAKPKEKKKTGAEKEPALKEEEKKLSDKEMFRMAKEMAKAQKDAEQTEVAQEPEEPQIEEPKPEKEPENVMDVESLPDAITKDAEE